MDFSITKIIQGYIKDKGISQRKLAELLNQSTSNFNQKLSKNDMNMKFVMDICIALKHDFFLEASQRLPLGVRGSAKQGTSELEIALRNFIETNYPKIKK